jgi:Arc/MetJ-type ribon-helix-helix transcriptional regulator
MRKSSKYTTVSIPTELAEKAREQIKETGFKNLSDYVAFILREIVASKGEWDGAKSTEDREIVKRKLKALGYL